MEIPAQLMQKTGIVATQLAREWVTLAVGDRIATVDEYARKFGSGRGTVQTAVKMLTDSGAVALEARGHLGTFIHTVDYETLWQFTGYGAVMGVMPLPYSRRYEGLATGLYLAARSRQLPFSLAYMRGAEQRLAALLSGRYDFAITSRLAAVQAIREGRGLKIAVGFGPFSYVSQHALILADRKRAVIEDGMKVGVDRTSIDHYLLTNRLCQGKTVSFVELTYNQILSKLQLGEIDAAVWNIDEIVERKLDIPFYPLANDEFADMDTEAVLVVNSRQSGMKHLLKAWLDPAVVVDYQNQVLNGRLVPNY